MSMKRPDGSAHLKASFWLFGLSLFLGVGAMNTKVTDYRGNIDPDGLAMRSLWGIASGGLFGLAILLMSVGWIIRAIYFLPGREVEGPDESIVTDEGDATAKRNPVVSAILIILIIAVVGFIAQALLIPRA